ncbi:MAG: PDZ domain-containing protein [Pirellulaceae bacterium]
MSARCTLTLVLGLVLWSGDVGHAQLFRGGLLRKVFSLPEPSEPAKQEKKNESAKSPQKNAQSPSSARQPNQSRPPKQPLPSVMKGKPQGQPRPATPRSNASDDFDLQQPQPPQAADFQQKLRQPFSYANQRARANRSGSGSRNQASPARANGKPALDESNFASPGSSLDELVMLGMKIQVRQDNLVVVGVAAEDVADQAGVKVGDIVKSLGGFEAKRLEELKGFEDVLNNGDRLELTVVRDKREQKLDLIYQDGSGADLVPSRQPAPRQVGPQLQTPMANPGVQQELRQQRQTIERLRAQLKKLQGEAERNEFGLQIP